MFSTFSAFTTARLAMYASQACLNTTGHNIANINTPGYTRQRVDMASFISGGTGKYTSPNIINPGNGVMMTGISQLRNPYLDIRFRNEMTSVGGAEGKLNGLQEIQSILDELSKDGVKMQFEDLEKCFQNLAAENVSADEFQTLIRSSAESLVKLFNNYAKQLETKKELQEIQLDQDVQKVNDILTKIQELNKEITNADIFGTPALELRDQRNMLIDELSSFINIDVQYKNVPVGAGKYVEELSITIPDMKNADGNPLTLIKGDAKADISIPDQIGTPPQDNTSYQFQIGNLIDVNGEVDQTQQIILQEKNIKGSLESVRQMLTGAGEFRTDGGDQTIRGIPYYEKSLDLLANKFASMMNELNTRHPDGTPFDDMRNDDGSPVYPGAGDLFSSGKDGGPITAGNISISDKWLSGEVKVVTSFDSGDPSQSTQNNNINRFIALFRQDIGFAPSDIDGNASSSHIFKGSFTEMYTNMVGVLSNDINTTQTVLDTYAATAESINTDRDSVSGVDLNEEGTHLMQYQKSFAAACRLMTALDEALDKVINGMGVVGR